MRSRVYYLYALRRLASGGVARRKGLLRKARQRFGMSSMIICPADWTFQRETREPSLNRRPLHWPSEASCRDANLTGRGGRLLSVLSADAPQRSASVCPCIRICRYRHLVPFPLLVVLARRSLRPPPSAGREQMASWAFDGRRICRPTLAANVTRFTSPPISETSPAVDTICEILRTLLDGLAFSGRRTSALRPTLDDS